MQYSYDEIKEMQSRLSPGDIPKMISNRRDWMYLGDLINLLLFNFPALGEDKKNTQRAKAFIQIAVTQGIIEQTNYSSMSTALFRIVEPEVTEASETQAA